MSKIFKHLSLLFLLFFFKPVQAANLGDAFSSTASSAALKMGYSISGPNADLNTILSTAITFILGLLGVIFIGLFIYGGVIWMTANGNEQKVEKASDVIKESLIGLVVVLAAYAISYFLFSVFSGQLK